VSRPYVFSSLALTEASMRFIGKPFFAEDRTELGTITRTEIRDNLLWCVVTFNATGRKDFGQESMIFPCLRAEET
jgi:hypothetical protein